MKLFNFSVNNDFGPIVKILSLFLMIFFVCKILFKILIFPVIAFKKVVKKRFPDPMEF